MRLSAVAMLAFAGCLGASAQAPDAARLSEDAVRRLREDRDGMVWSLLGQSADNSVRSFVIRDVVQLGVAPDVVIQRLRVETDVSARRSLVLILGGYRRDELSPSLRESLQALLVRLRAGDPDPGLHAAAAWALRRAGDDVPPLKPQPLSSDRRWYVTAEGQMMTTFAGPVSVRMGSPAGEPGRQPASDSPPEPLHVVTIPRSFAVAAAEVTVAAFRRFLEANPDPASKIYQYPDAPDRMAEVLARFSPDGDGPAIAVTWYEAAMYCNWLSAREGLPPSEWVYPAGLLAAGMRMPANYLRRTGYRLPTEAEWEFAARAGTTTSRFFGATADLLGDYAWFARNPPRSRSDPVDPSDPQRTSPVGRLMPNDAGLFDVYGNVWEWTQDRVERHQGGQIQEDGEDSTLQVVDQDARTRRGGAFPYEAAMARSAARGTVASLPTTRRDNVGFRIARTLPALTAGATRPPDPREPRAAPAPTTPRRPPRVAPRSPQPR